MSYLRHSSMRQQYQRRFGSQPAAATATTSPFFAAGSAATASVSESHNNENNGLRIHKEGMHNHVPMRDPDGLGANAQDVDIGDVLDRIRDTVGSVLRRRGFPQADVLDMMVQQQQQQQHHDYVTSQSDEWSDDDEKEEEEDDGRPNKTTAEQEGRWRMVGVGWKQQCHMLAFRLGIQDVWQIVRNIVLVLAFGWFMSATKAGYPGLSRIASLLFLAYWALCLYHAAKHFRLSSRMAPIQVVFPVANISDDLTEKDKTKAALASLGPNFRWGWYHPQRGPGYGKEPDAEFALIWTIYPWDISQLVVDTDMSYAHGIFGNRMPWLRHFWNQLVWLTAPKSLLTILCVLGFVIGLSNLLVHWQGYNRPQDGIYRVWHALLRDTRVL